MASGAIPSQYQAQFGPKKTVARHETGTHNFSGSQSRSQLRTTLRSTPVSAPPTVSELSSAQVQALHRRINPVLSHSHVHHIDLSVVDNFGTRSSFVAFKRSDGLYQCYQISTDGQKTSVENWGEHDRLKVPKGTDLYGSQIRFTFLEPQHSVSVLARGIAGQNSESTLKFSESSYLGGLLKFQSLNFIRKDQPSLDQVAMQKFADQFKKRPA